MGPLVSYDSLQSPSKLISLTRIREGESDGAMALAFSSFPFLAQLNRELAGVGVGVGIGQRDNGPPLLR